MMVPHHPHGQGPRVLGGLDVVGGVGFGPLARRRRRRARLGFSVCQVGGVWGLCGALQM